MELKFIRELAMKSLNEDFKRIDTQKGAYTMQDFEKELAEGKTKLEEYLETLDKHEILLLQTLMYIGRDERKPRNMSEQEFFYHMLESVKRDFPYFDKNKGIEYMTGKKDLKQYWRDGLQKIK